MAADAVASVVLQKLSDMIVEESFASNKIIGRRLKRLQEALEATSWRSFVVDEDTNNAEEIKKCIDEYLGHLYSIEDSIESFALSFTRQRRKLGCLMNHALFLKKFTALKILDSKLYSIQTEVRKLNISLTNSLQSRGDISQHQLTESEDDGGNEQDEESEATFSSIDEETEGRSTGMKRTMSSPFLRSLVEKPANLKKNKSSKVLLRSNGSMMRERNAHSRLMFSYSYNEEELSIVGYPHKVRELRHRLQCYDDRVIPIVGELGSGKTMLARAVYGNRSIKNMFEPSAWVSIFKESTRKEIILALLNQMNRLQAQNRSNEASLEEKLVQELTGRKYLIVLDGVQTWDQWEMLKDVFPDQQNGSKIIITTSDYKAERDMKWQNPYNLEELSPDESWTLFMKKAGSLIDPEPYIKKKIIEICRGLPLNIILLGSLLSTKEREKWSETLRYYKRKQQPLELMKLSYSDLDNHLKLCLTYMTLFPKELDIPVRRLQRLWLAEGFVERPSEGVFQEDVALDYFENLVKRSLIMVSKQRSDGSARRCRLHSALHGFLSEKAKDIGLFRVNDHESSSTSGTRRLVEYANAGHSQLEPCELRKVRSYVSFNLQKKDTPAKHVESLVSKMMGKGLGLLRVLDLERVYKPSLPENLGDLFHLRYLGLRWTFLDKLPKSVGELPFLQTLDLKHTYIDKIPTSVWKLKNLQHLNLDDVHLDKNTLLHLQRSLPELLTLWGLVVSHESPIENGLNKLKHLRELGISFRFTRREGDAAGDRRGSMEALVKWISEQTELRSLRLHSRDDNGHPTDLSLIPFSNLRKLSHMKLLGKLQQLPKFHDFPPNIKVLTLSLSYLSEDPMPILGQLPDLTVLRLLGNSYVGKRLVCSCGSFKKLEVLKLWVLERLEKLEVEEGAMEKLKEVNIRTCSNMESFPSNLLQQKTFQKLILNNMPPAFKESMDKNYHFKVSTKDFKATSELNV